MTAPAEQPARKPTRAQLQRVLLDVLDAYDDYLDTDVLDRLAEVIGRARAVLGVSDVG